MIFKKVPRNLQNSTELSTVLELVPVRKKWKNKNSEIEDSTVNFNMILIGFGWLACTVRCMSERRKKKSNNEDHLHEVV